MAHNEVPRFMLLTVSLEDAIAKNVDRSISIPLPSFSHTSRRRKSRFWEISIPAPSCSRTQQTSSLYIPYPSQPPSTNTPSVAGIPMRSIVLQLSSTQPTQKPPSVTSHDTIHLHDLSTTYTQPPKLSPRSFFLSSIRNPIKIQRILAYPVLMNADHIYISIYGEIERQIGRVGYA